MFSQCAYVHPRLGGVVTNNGVCVCMITESIPLSTQLHHIPYTKAGVIQLSVRHSMQHRRIKGKAKFPEKSTGKYLRIGQTVLSNTGIFQYLELGVHSFFAIGQMKRKRKIK